MTTTAAAYAAGLVDGQDWDLTDVDPIPATGWDDATINATWGNACREYNRGVGAVAAPNAYGWQLETTLGGLRVGSRGHYIVQVFDDWPRAKAAGFDHWKWNFHYEIGAAEDEVDHWKRQLARVLPPIECDVGTLAFR
jgi:hypothetical protein